MVKLNHMFVTITTSKVTAAQLSEVEKFLQVFLPRLQKEQPGVVAILHYARPDKGDDSTIIVWDNPSSVQAYRSGELIKEAIAFEKKLNLSAAREGYPLNYGSGFLLK